jgi:hypothetical protein
MSAVHSRGDNTTIPKARFYSTTVNVLLPDGSGGSPRPKISVFVRLYQIAGPANSLQYFIYSLSVTKVSQ